MGVLECPTHYYSRYNWSHIITWMFTRLDVNVESSMDKCRSMVMSVLDTDHWPARWPATAAAETRYCRCCQAGSVADRVVKRARAYFSWVSPLRLCEVKKVLLLIRPPDIDMSEGLKLYCCIFYQTPIL